MRPIRIRTGSDDKDGQRGDFTSHHDVASMPGVRVAHALRQETGRPQHGYNIRAVVDTSAGTDIVGEKGGNGETCTQQNRYFIPVSPIHPPAKNLSGGFVRARTEGWGRANVDPAGGIPIRIPTPSKHQSAKNLSGESARSRIGEQGCAKIDLAEVGIRIPAPSIPSTAKNLCTEVSA